VSLCLSGNNVQLKFSIDWGEEAEACSPFFCLPIPEPELIRQSIKITINEI
jgi:hypothetical protein